MRSGLSGWVLHSLVLEGLEWLSLAWHGHTPPVLLYIFHLVWRNGTLWSSQYYLFLQIGVWSGRGWINFNTPQDLMVPCVSAVNVTIEELEKNLALLASWPFKTLWNLSAFVP